MYLPTAAASAITVLATLAITTSASPILVARDEWCTFNFGCLREQGVTTPGSVPVDYLQCQYNLYAPAGERVQHAPIDESGSLTFQPADFKGNTELYVSWKYDRDTDILYGNTWSAETGARGLDPVYTTEKTSEPGTNATIKQAIGTLSLPCHY